VGPHYASSKSALHGIIHWIAQRYARDGVVSLSLVVFEDNHAHLNLIGRVTAWLLHSSPALG
jgi:hypothetical protein